ncbi:DNA-3-methyladenine glycosylase family protein [Parafilimonas sp.]|uniref:DNA-3-methyladenine glycosylase family protein n=1 Tax=Parafilimonas sp. TaxID=1969739 RepID=UPI003F7F1619
MEYIEHLSKDKKLAAFINGPVHERIQPHKNIPVQLIGSIMSQQLSTKVADVIYKRFLALYNDKPPKPQQIIDTPNEMLRAIGLSNAKVNYVKNVAVFCMEHKVTDKKLHAMSNEDIIALLTQIKGVGKWTVEMLLMFALGREDVFSIDDYGVRSAMIKIYKLEKLDKKKLNERLLKISGKWSPYRTYGCLYCWHLKDNAPVVEKA